MNPLSPSGIPLLDAASAPAIIVFGLSALILLAAVVSAVVAAIVFIVRAVRKKKAAPPAGIGKDAR